MRRTGVTLALAAGVVVTSASPALAQPLEEWLDRAARAEFEGRQVTICETPEGRISEVVDVAQKDGVVVVTAPGGEVVIQAGAVMTTETDGSASLATVESASNARLADRYRPAVRGQSQIINRAVDIVEVLEGDLVRVRYAFDGETGAVLRSDVNNGDGSAYCTTQFVEFRPQTNITVAEPSDVREVLLTALATDASLPETVAGFSRLDTYEGPQGSVAAFYTDGIFSFTVIVADRKIIVPELSGAPDVNLDGSSYVRRFTPGQVVYSWETPDGGLVMIGDLPADLQEAVLSDLPEPGVANLLVRLWRRLFR